MRRLAVLFLAVSFISYGAFAPAFAQSAPAAPERAEQGDTPVSMPKAEGLNSYANDDDRALDDGYVIPTFKNLSKLYWALIVKEAGGYVGTLDGKGDPIYDGDILASNMTVIEAVRKILATAAKETAAA